MDVIIPAHNLKTLSSSLSTLSKIGKYLYFEFDPLTGLTLRTINDAKSSFGQFHFDVGFFERCTSPPGAILSKKKKTSRAIGIGEGTGSGDANGSRTNRSRNRNRNRIEANERKHSRSSSDRRGRQRKRSRSQQPDENENHDNGGAGATAADENESAHNAEDSNKNGQQSNDNNNENNNRDDDDDDDGDDDDDDDDEEKYLCRVFIKTVASVLRSRRGVQSLRIRSLGSQFEGGRNNNMNGNADGGANTTGIANSNEDNNGGSDDDDDADNGGAKMQLSFEFRIQSEGVMRIKHIIGVSDADAVVAVAEKTGCSEIVVTPRVLLKMVEPVKSSEVALIISDTEKRVTATSFHYTDAATRTASTSALLQNALLNANAATVLKTETSIGVDEFDEFNFLDGNGEDLPDGANKEVVLVFSIKEAKAMLQFCAQTSIDEELRAIVSFYWGGRPLIIETEGDSFTGELILATVAHNLLNGVDLTSRGSNGGQNRRVPTRN